MARGPSCIVDSSQLLVRSAGQWLEHAGLERTEEDCPTDRLGVQDIDLGDTDRSPNG